MPRLDGGADVELDAALRDVADGGKFELKMRCEPFRLHVVAVRGHVLHHVGEVIPHEVRQ
ncbi:unannotated protein [freshwater metagenome]|uniref:Unannotated protein n=1 Tax=freshwater metagenome TaxID=449393 RepID=A0A6J6F595_9ZZZZ